MEKRILVGAPSSRSDNGKVYAYVKYGTSWFIEQAFVDDLDQSTGLDGSIALLGNRVVVGATGAHKTYVFDPITRLVDADPSELVISESATIGSVVGVDINDPIYSDSVFSLVVGSDYFNIDASTGSGDPRQAIGL